MRTGFHYRPKKRSSKLGFLMGLYDFEDPRELINYCIDEVYRASVQALNKAKEDQRAEKSNPTKSSD